MNHSLTDALFVARYKPDNVFDMPKVNLMAQIRTAIAYESPQSNVLTSLWTNVLEEHCNEFT